MERLEMKKFKRTLLAGILASISAGIPLAQEAASAPPIAPWIILRSATGDPRWESGFCSTEGALAALSWFAGRGYPHLVPDGNRNGRMDAQDSAELARALAEFPPPASRSSRNEAADLALAVARLLSQRAAGAFCLDIYPAGILSDSWKGRRAEFPNLVVPGVAITVREGPVPFPRYALGMLHVRWGSGMTAGGGSPGFFCFISSPRDAGAGGSGPLPPAAAEADTEGSCTLVTEENTRLLAHTRVVREPAGDRYIYEITNDDIEFGYSYTADYVFIPNPDRLPALDLSAPAGWTGWLLSLPGVSGWLWETGRKLGIGGQNTVSFSFTVLAPSHPASRTLEIAGQRGYPCYCMEYTKSLEILAPTGTGGSATR
jgi:hypothetical protein